MNAGADRRPTRVWDLPTRLFHWLLVIAVVAAVATAKVGGNAMVWHVRLGLVVMGLLAFRLAWGVVGGHWSRFKTFDCAPSSLRAYLRGGTGPQGRFEVGHSPLGAWAVLGMLALLLLQVATGLVADDEVATTGPLNAYVSAALAGRASDWHEHMGQWLIWTAVIAHVAAVIVYRVRFGRDLLRPMINGDKLLPVGAERSIDGAAQRALALALAIAAAVGAWWVGRLGGP